MSRLIEALKKAEEAKQKESKGTSDSDSLELELEPVEPKKTPATSVNENTESDIQYPASLEEADERLELQPTFSLEEQKQETVETPEPESQHLADEEPAIQATIESAPASPSGSNPETPEDGRDPMRRRLTDEQQMLEDEERIVEKSHRKRLYLMVFIVILLIVGFAGFFFYMMQEENPYSVPTTDSQNRGFLVSQESRSTREALINQTIRANEAPEEVHTTIGESESRLEDIPAEETEISPDARTISAVNALLNASEASANIEQDEISLEAASANTEPPVFVISRENPVSGSEDTLNFAATNAAGGETEAARNELTELLNREPKNIAALSRLAQIEIESGNTFQASEYFSRILELDPRNITANTGLVKATQATNPEQYEAQLRELARRFPQAAYIPFMLGNQLSAESRWSEAKGAYLSALDIAGNDVPPDYLFNLAISLEHLQQQGDALSYYKQAEDLLNSSHASFDTSVLLSRIEQLESATE